MDIDHQVEIISIRIESEGNLKKNYNKKKKNAETGLREHRKVPGWRSEGKDPFSRELCNVTFERNERWFFENGCGFRISLEQFAMEY